MTKPRLTQFQLHCVDFVAIVYVLFFLMFLGGVFKEQTHPESITMPRLVPPADGAYVAKTQ